MTLIELASKWPPNFFDVNKRKTFDLLSFGFCRFGQWEKIKALGLISFVNIDIEEGTLSFSIVVVVLLEVVKLQSCFL